MIELFKRLENRRTRETKMIAADLYEAVHEMRWMHRPKGCYLSDFTRERMK